jgi:hypothetical protein
MKVLDPAKTGAVDLGVVQRLLTEVMAMPQVGMVALPPGASCHDTAIPLSWCRLIADECCTKPPCETFHKDRPLAAALAMLSAALQEPSAGRIVGGLLLEE